MLRSLWTGRSRRSRAAIAALCVLLAVAGAVLIATGVHGSRTKAPSFAALPSSASAAATAGPPTSAPSTPAPSATASYADFHLSIPALGVQSDLMQLGLNSDGTVQVPPLTKDAPAGWYKYSPVPGDLGPSVILGHIDSAAYGPGVFYTLRNLRPGDSVVVDRADHQVATFNVDSVAEYPKNVFPTDKIYGDTPNAQLRLITCGGQFDSATGSYEDNIVAYATLASLTSG
jgi:hypothetical protein